MKKIICAVFMLVLSLTIYAQEVKTIEIYSNKMTHDNIKANITYGENNKIVKDEFFYTVTSEAMWTKKMNTVIAYSGSYDQICKFFTEVLRFADENKDNMKAIATIDGREISRKKVAGMKCIVIKNGDESTNTNIKSLTKALESLKKWKSENQK